MRPKGVWSSSGTQNMHASMGQYSMHAGEPAQPVQQSVVMASMRGFFLRVALPSPTDIGQFFSTIPIIRCSVRKVSGRRVQFNTAAASDSINFCPRRVKIILPPTTSEGDNGMSTVAVIFNSRAEAEVAASALEGVGVSKDRISLLTPGTSQSQLDEVPTTETEQPGMGKALGGTVGGALGIAGGLQLGAAAASLFLPGVGPIIAAGVAAGGLRAGGGGTGAGG